MQGVVQTRIADRKYVEGTQSPDDLSPMDTLQITAAADEAAADEVGTGVQSVAMDVTQGDSTDSYQASALLGRREAPTDLDANPRDDRVDGGDGNDQVLGEDGNDRVEGGAGEDLIMGGAGSDSIDGGAGGDAIYADREDTSIDAGRSDRSEGPDAENDVIIAEEGSVAAENLGVGDVELHYDPEATERYLREHPELVIDGSDDFVARTTADIGVMLTTDQGRGLLDELTGALEGDEKLRFVEEKEGAGGSYTAGDNIVRVGMYAEQYDDGASRVPLPALFHELVHAYQDLVSGYPQGRSTFDGGGAVRNAELQATGLEWIDKDGTLHPTDELRYTDNQFRRELGLPERSKYDGQGGTPVGYEPEPTRGRRWGSGTF